MKPRETGLKVARGFIYTSAILLLCTAVAKFISTSGSATILKVNDPIFGIPFRVVFWAVGTIEVAVALNCFFGRRTGIQAGGIAWLATCFLLYRVGLVLVGYHKSCPCLGSLTDALHVPPATAASVMRIVFGYLLVGSYATLLWLWRRERKTLRPTMVGAQDILSRDVVLQ
jgi:hypothetical protein